MPEELIPLYSWLFMARGEVYIKFQLKKLLLGGQQHSQGH